MKKIYKVLVASCFLLAGLSFVSCDNESIDPTLENGTMVGKQVVTLNLQGESYLEREHIVATINKNRELVFTISNLGETGEDSLVINLKKFVIGNFPTNVNESKYYSKSEDAWYTTKDTDRPNWVTGFISMDNINKQARVFSGSIDIKNMMPTTTDNPNLKSFPISGNFEDIVYTRLEATYFDAIVNGEPMQNSKEEKLRVDEDGKLLLTGTDEVGKTQSLLISIPVEQKLEANTKYELDVFAASYTSPEGVRYVSTSEKRKDSYMLIDEVTYNDKDEIKTLKGRFDLVLSREGENEGTVKITDGEFSLELAEPEKPELVEAEK